MSRIGKVMKSFIQKLSGSNTNAQMTSVEEFSGDQRTAQVFGPCNEDFAPPENCMTNDETLGKGRGYLITTAYHNQSIDPVAIHGERRLFSTNKAGNTLKTEVFLKQTGEILIQNDNASITMTPAGAINIVAAGNTNITSALTAINNDLEVDGYINGSEKTSDPSPATEHFAIWQSTGAGSGDAGDIMIKINSGGVSKTTTLVDFSALP